MAEENKKISVQEAFGQFPGTITSPYDETGKMEVFSPVKTKEVNYLNKLEKDLATEENITKKADIEKNISTVKNQETQDIFNKYKNYIPTERFTIGRKDYMVMNAGVPFEELLPYEQVYILQDQGVDISGSQFDQLKKDAEDYRQGNVLFPGYSSPIPFYPTDPRYKEEYQSQVEQVYDASLKEKDPINYYTGGMLDRETTKAFGAMLAPILTVAGRSFLLGGMTMQGVPGVGTAAGTAAMATGATMTLTGMYIQGLISSGAGSAAFGQVYDNMNKILRDDFTGFGDLSDNSKRAMKDFASEFMWTGGADSLAGTVRYMGAPLLKKVMSLGSEKSSLLQKYADDLGIQLAPIHFANKATKGTSKVLGVFPVINWAFTKGGEVGQRNLVNFMDSYMGTFGPMYTLNTVGVNALKGAKSNKKLGSQAVEAAYKMFADMASKIDAPIVKGRNISQILNSESLKIAATSSDETAKVFQQMLQIQSNPYFKDNLDQLRSIIEKNGGLTITQARDFQKKLNKSMGDYIKNAGKTDFTDDEAAALLNIKTALETDLQSIRLTDIPEQYQSLGKKALDTLNHANNLYMKWASTFIESPASKVFGKSDIAYRLNLGPEMYKPTRTSRQKLYKDMFSVMKEDPEAMADFKKILGDDEFNSAIGSWMNDAYTGSFAKALPIDDTTGKITMDAVIESNAFNPEVFAKKIGLDNSAGRQALESAIGKDKVKTLDKFIELANAVDEVTVGDPSTFLGRRVVLTGLTGFLGGFAVGGPLVGAAGAAGAVAVKAIVGYGAFSFINNPKNLDKLVKWYEKVAPLKTLNRKLIAEFEQIAKDAGIPTEAEDSMAFQQAKQLEKILSGGDRTISGPRGIPTINAAKEKKRIKSQDTINILEELNKQQTTSTMPTEMQTSVFQAPPGLSGTANAATYASLFPFDTTGQQAAMSMEQRPRIAAQGGLGALLGFKGTN
jgi:hypothetical protein